MDQGRYRRLAIRVSVGVRVGACVELGWVGLCFADRIRQDGVRNAKYSLGMGAGAADGLARRPRRRSDDESCMYGSDGTGYDKGRTRAEQQKRGLQGRRTCKIGRERKEREIGAQFCAWEAIPLQTRPDQASETVGLPSPTVTLGVSE